MSDDERLLELFADDRILKDLDLNIKLENITIEKERDMLKKAMKNYKMKKPKKYSFGIIANNELIGVIGTTGKDIDYENGNSEFGYWIGSEYWRKGYATAAVRLFCDFLFERFGLVRVFACPYVHNRASQRVLEKNGFAHEGTRKKVFKKGNDYLDDVIYAKVK
jgi:[ribosomal protein S5]-alanine N-acetyltransferase